MTPRWRREANRPGKGPGVAGDATMDLCVCDHCGWLAFASEAMLDPPAEADRPICPTCWDAGWVAGVRPWLGSLVEAVCPPDPSPRARKPLIFWTDEEWAIAERTERFRDAHERAPVTFDTGIAGRRQGGFDWMREPFRVKGESCDD